MDEQMILDSILEEVGEGRLNIDEAMEELRVARIYVTPGYFKSLLAFRGSAILQENGFNRIGQPQPV